MTSSITGKSKAGAVRAAVRDAGAAMAVGAIAGIMAVVLAASFAAFVFVGPLSPLLPRGVGMNLFASAVVIVVLAVRSTHPGVVAVTQDAPAVVLGLAAQNIAAAADGGDEVVFLTVVLAISLTSLASGTLFFVLGLLRVGNLVRFVPYPVVQGFLAGTGWLFLKGAVATMTGFPLSMETFPDLAKGDVAILWLPGLALAVALLVAVPRYRHFLLVPGIVIGAVAVFHTLRVAAGASLADSARWLVGGLPEGGLWRPWTARALFEADWGAVAGQTPTLASAVLVALLVVLLNASGIEVAVDRDADVNRELRAAGLGNILASPTGGSIGSAGMSLTTLAHRAGTPSRVVGITGAAVCLTVLVFGAALVSGFPRFVLGGLILFLGFDFLIGAVYRTWSSLSLGEYAVVILILAVVALVGFLPAVGIGLVAAVVLFAVSYSKIDVVRDEASGATRSSNVERPEEQREALARLGERVHVLELQGYLFFGTARGVLTRVDRRVHDAGLPPLGFLVLDFHRVAGMDSSAVQSFARIMRLAETTRFDVVLAHLSADVERRLRRGGLEEGRHERLKVLPDGDHAMEWCEDMLLARADVGEVHADSLWSRLERLGGRPIDVPRLRSYLTRAETRPGDVLIRQGEVADDLFFLESGTVTITAEAGGRSIRLRTAGPGTIVGELPLYLGTSRTATVVAESACVVHRLTAEAFRHMEDRDPDLASVLHRVLAHLLAQRLRDTLTSVAPALD